MTVCPSCNQEMTDRVGCTANPGRIVYDRDGHCHDCYTPSGQMHHPGCDMERCEHGNQMIGDCPECDREVKRQEMLDLLKWGKEHGFPQSLEEAARMDEEEREQTERKRQAQLCAQAQIDSFFADAGYGDMFDAQTLAIKIADALAREGRLS